MDKRTVDRLVDILESLAQRAHEFTVKVAALENMLHRHPDLELEYKAEIRTLNDSLANRTNFQSISAAIQEIRTTLLRQ